MAGNTSTIDRLFAEGFLSADDKMLQTFAHPADEEEMGDNIERIGQAAGAASAVFQSFMRHGLLGFDAPSGPQGISLRLYCADSRMGCVDFSDRLDVQTVGPKDGWERDFVDEVAFLVVNSSLAIKGKIEPRKLSQQSPTHLASPPASPSSCTYSPNVRMACGNHDTIASISQLCSNSISSKKAKTMPQPRLQPLAPNRFKHTDTRLPVSLPEQDLHSEAIFPSANFVPEASLPPGWDAEAKVKRVNHSLPRHSPDMYFDMCGQHSSSGTLSKASLASTSSNNLQYEMREITQAIEEDQQEDYMLF
ncbi:MAG: hypothetical protein CYPHOPRED_002180 [Cyphobasidiales sp. Tagirdzhanova-0007]|nr:MAG: hypothetical protein CYPHOPRED_002180 [Cyphobasidiales sp. Tagirdzhanova-0007]